MRTCPKCQRTYPDEMDYCPRDATALISVVSSTQAELESSLAQRFRIVRRLGGGGMGAVFLAEQIAVGNRPVALKVLLRKLLDDPEFLIRFRNEAGSTGRINHPNVVTIHESGQADDGTPYIAMEYLEGESLRARLKTHGALPIEECAAIVLQAARGLSAAHRLGIIHRDLKPDNIFLTKDAEGELLVKVVDFGIAKLRESATHTLTGTVLGTPVYMSFEQASGMKSEELDARSDIYSFGVVAYEMLTGRVPFHSDTPVGYIRKHLMENPPPFHVVKPELSAPQLEQVVMKALAKDREARFASVLEFAGAFSEAARGVDPKTPLPATKVTPVVAAVSPPPPSPAPKPVVPAVSSPPVFVKRETAARTPPLQSPRKSRVSLWSGLAAAVLLLALGGWYISSRGPSAGHNTPTFQNAPVAQPQSGPGSSAGVNETKPPVVETATPAPSLSETNLSNRRQVQAAKARGDSYYENGEYAKAINAYQAGLKLDPSNGELRKAIERAQSAKAAEQKFGR